MGLMSTLFGGSSYSSPGWMRDAGRQSYEDYLAAMGENFGPQAYRRNVSNYRENYDRNLQNQQAAAGGNLMGRGVRPGAAPMFSRQAAGDLARFQSGEQARLAEGRMRGYGNQIGMLGNLQGLYQRQQKPGLLQRLAPLAGAYGQYAAMSQQSPVLTAGEGNPYAGQNVYYTGPDTQQPMSPEHYDYLNALFGAQNGSSWSPWG